MTLSAPSHLISLSRTAPARLRAERLAWIEDRRREGHLVKAIAEALGVHPDHVSKELTVARTGGGHLRERCERHAEALLEGPLARRNWTAATRDAVAAHIEHLLLSEGVRA